MVCRMPPVSPAPDDSPETRARDRKFMRRALQFAKRGWGRVHPNPLVGALVAHGDLVIGEGYHAEYGEPHAEFFALTTAGERARGATLYVTLEPCAHHGKQPPCVEAILAAGIARVVVALRDPNPVAAGGVEYLRERGVVVDVGLMAEEVAVQNARFLWSLRSPGRPWVVVKLAVSMDGRIADADGTSRWISGPEARNWVHRMRAAVGGVAVGAATAIADNSRLTVRGPIIPRQAPVRVLFDRSGVLSAEHGIFHDGSGIPIHVVRGLDAAAADAPLQQAGATVHRVASLADGVASLGAAGIDSLLVEGGGRLAGALWQAGLVDRVCQIQSPLWLGEAGTPAWAGLHGITLATTPRWRVIGRKELGMDTLLVLEP